MGDRSTLGDLIVMHGPYEPYAQVPQPVMRFIESDQLDALRSELIQLRDFQNAVMHAVEQMKAYETPEMARLRAQVAEAHLFADELDNGREQPSLLATRLRERLYQAGPGTGSQCPSGVGRG